MNLSNKAKILILFFTLIYAFCCLAIGGFNLLNICIITSILLGIPTYLSSNLGYKSTFYFCLISFITNLFNIPFFFSQDHSLFKGLNFFDYKLNTTLTPILYISLFLFLTVFITWIIERYIKKPPIIFKKNNPRNKIKGNLYFDLLIILVITFSIPLQIFMFQNEIGFIGIESRELPFKLNGILFYFTRIIIPLIIGFLYNQSKKGLFLSIIILIFANISALIAISRFPGVLISSIILYFSFFQRKFITSFLASISLSSSFIIATLMRRYTQYAIVDDGNKFLTTNISEFNIFYFFDTVINDYEISILSFLTIGILYAISRLDSFGSILQAFNYDFNNVYGFTPFNIILEGFPLKLQEYDIDAHHIEWQGYTLPEGLFHGPTLFSQVVILRDNNYFLWLITFAIVVTFSLVIWEIIIKKLINKYNFDFNFYRFGMIFVVAFIVVDRGSSSLLLLFLLLISLSILPRIRI